MLVQKLHALEMDPDLIRLEYLISGFNIFEAIGVTRHEIRHSSLLAFLLDPFQSHGLGDKFLRHFLSAAIPDGERERYSELDKLDTHDIVVRREFHSIDICISSASSKLVVIIENKIGSGEHSNQLNRYMDLLRERFPGYQIIGMYLTPDGLTASNEDYVAVDYTTVVGSIDAILEQEISGGDSALSVLLSHYARMLRRHVVKDSEVARLSRDIYRRHRQALDSIMDHRPSMTQVVVNAIKAEPSIEFLATARGGEHIQFTSPDWNGEPRLVTKWPPANRLLLFQFCDETRFEGELRLELLVGRGDARVVDMIRAAAEQNGTPFKVIPAGPRGMWQLFSAVFLTRTEVEEDIGAQEKIFVR